MNNWIERNRAYTLVDAADNFSIAFAGMKFTDADLDKLAPKFERAAREMAYLCGYDAKSTPEILSISVEPDKVRYFWCCINVKYKNLDGDLTAYGDNPMGFSITSEGETPYLFPYRGISNVTLKGDTVSVRTELTAEQLKSVSLWYGVGLSCACTITDGGGMAIPAFGPIKLSEWID